MQPANTLLHGLTVLQLGPGLAAAVCGRLLADAGARVLRSADLGDFSPDDRARSREQHRAAAGDRHLGNPRDPSAAVPDAVSAAPRAEQSAHPSDSHAPLRSYLDHGKPAYGDHGDSADLDHGGSADPGHGGSADDGRMPDIVIVEGSPATLRRRGHAPERLRAWAPGAVLVLISPYGQTGPCAEEPATDLTLMAASGIMRMLTGQVEDLTEPPVRAVGEQSAFLGGIAAACAGMHAALKRGPSVVDVSMQEALATLAMAELSRAGQTGRSWSRRREADGNGATVCILPARDGYAAISPREERQWKAWLAAMGSPAWGDDPRFARKPDRVANWDALHGLMSAWSRDLTRQEIADRAQAAHVPSFPLREVGEHLEASQLDHRGFWRPVAIDGRELRAPGAPFGLRLRPGAPSEPAPRPVHAEADQIGTSDQSGGNSQSGATDQIGAADQIGTRGQSGGDSQGGASCSNAADDHRLASDRRVAHPHHPAITGPLPLAGIRVLDFSWVIAGPTATRYLAAMGAEVIKVEAPGPGDPGRASGLHEVLGQGKRGIVLDLKHPAGVAAARELAARCDIVLENFATGVMDRLGLGADTLQALNPALIYVSASGLGRTGPDSHAVAYGTLLQCYAGFAGLNRHPDRAPRVGMAWLDPMCGLMLAFVAAAAIWARRRTGLVARADFSMTEAMLWTMAAPILAAQAGPPPVPQGNRDPDHAPHGVYRCAGEDAWIAIAVPDEAAWDRLTRLVPALVTPGRHAPESDAVLGQWSARHAADAARDLLQAAGVPCAVVADAVSLATSPHLREREFWQPHGPGVLPGLPWRASFGFRITPAPELGGDTDSVLRELVDPHPPVAKHNG